jgi:isopenicillin-N epimerase
MAPGKERYRALFDWLGTDDPSAWLAAPEAIRVVGSLEAGGWPAVMERNHRLALAARGVVCSRLGVEPPAPGPMVGAMASLPLPDAVGPPMHGLSPLTARLMASGFEALVMSWPEWPRQVIRLSAHLYNELQEYRLLAEALSELVGGTSPPPPPG